MTPEGEPVTQQAIVAELKALRKGRGLRGDVAERTGPLLRELAAGPGSDPAGARRALAEELAKLAELLPGDLRLAILAALALHDATRDMRTYEQRREWLGGQIDRVPRTAERRVNLAQEQLAQEIASRLRARRGAPAVADDTGQWHIERFSALLLLDGDHPEAIERRLIRSNVPGLAELTVALDVPVDAGQPRLPLSIEAISGGELVITEETARTRTRYLVRLPRPLGAGEAHEYTIRIRVLDDRHMRDYYVLRPERRCDRFDLRVRFHRARLPAWVRRVADEDVYSYYTYSDVPGPRERVPVDLSGEAVQAFAGLRVHYGYGLQWGWAAPETG